MDKKTFVKIAGIAELENVTLHTLRHSFATVALDLGFSEMVIAALLGHRRGTVTARYAAVDRALIVAADRVSAQIEDYMSGIAVGAVVAHLLPEAANATKA